MQVALVFSECRTLEDIRFGRISGSSIAHVSKTPPPPSLTLFLALPLGQQGDLFDEVKRRGGRLPEAEVVQAVLTPYLQALMYLHARGVIHRDVKPENTVFTRDRVLKLTGQRGAERRRQRTRAAR